MTVLMITAGAALIVAACHPDVGPYGTLPRWRTNLILAGVGVALLVEATIRIVR